MSFTYPHYSAPSSLPSDYAILSRYAAANGIEEGEPTEENNQAGSSAMASDSGLLSPNAMPIPGQHHDEGVKRRSSFPTSYVTPFNPTTGPLPDKSGFRSGPHTANENTPLLAPLVPRIEEEVDDVDPNSETSANLLWEEARILTKYTIPVFGYVKNFALWDIDELLILFLLYRTHLLEYSLVIASVVSIGHLSTTALAASTLGSMTASVTGYSIIQGFASTLDTMLPSAWTSSQPQLVGLWSQRMGKLFHYTRLHLNELDSDYDASLIGSYPAVVMAASLLVSASSHSGDLRSSRGFILSNSRYCSPLV